MKVSDLVIRRPNLYGRHVPVLRLFACVENQQVARVDGKA